MKYRTLEEYKKDIFDKLTDDKKLKYMYEMSSQLCNVIDYAKKRCDEYLKDDEDCEFCDGVFASCRKILQLVGEGIKKYE